MQNLSFSLCNIYICLRYLQSMYSVEEKIQNKHTKKEEMEFISYSYEEISVKGKNN